MKLIREDKLDKLKADAYEKGWEQRKKLDNQYFKEMSDEIIELEKRIIKLKRLLELRVN